MTKTGTLQQRWDYIHRMLEEAGECECENCVKVQRTEMEQASSPGEAKR
jgi:hypothetical protein